MICIDSSDDTVTFSSIDRTFSLYEPAHMGGTPVWSNPMFLVVCVFKCKIPRWFFERYAVKPEMKDVATWESHVV